MAQSGFTPISLYYSSTVSQVPLAGNLAFGELAINILDGKLYFKNSVGAVTLLSSSAIAGGAFTTLSYSTSFTGTASATITDNSANPALRVTQTGAGLSILVEDSANPDSSPFAVDTSGNVGIGVLAPATKLQVVGGQILLDNGQFYGIKTSLGATNSVLALDASNNLLIGAGGATVSNLFYTGGAERMRIDAAGLVQIGSTGGIYKLNVFSDTPLSLYSAAGTGQTTFTIVGNATLSTNHYFSTGSTITFGTNANGAGVTERFRVDSLGNFDIGTTTSTEKFNVGQGNAYILRTGGAKLRLADQNNEVSFESLPVSLSTDAIFKTSGVERMRIDAVGNVGVGIVPSAWGTSGVSYKALEVGFGSTGSAALSSAGSTADISQNAYHNGTNWIYRTTNTASLYRQQASTHLWYTAPSGTAGATIAFTQAMTLDASGNLGVGTASPTSAAGFTFVTAQNTTNGAAFEAKDASIVTRFQSLTAQGYGSVSVVSNHPLAFLTNGVERARIDTSGNLGLGVTPSAWNSFPALQTTGNYALCALGYSNNMYYQTGYKYISTDFATRYEQGSGQHRWFNAPSGTLNTTITFTQAMTLDASGNLMVGGTSPLVTAAGRGNITINGSASSILNFGIGNVSAGYIFQTSSDFTVWNAVAGSMVFGTSNLERMRLDSTGNLGIGTTTPGTKLEIFNGSGSSPNLSGTSGNFAITQPGLLTSLQMGGYAIAPYSLWMQGQNKSGSSFPLVLNPLGGNVGIGLDAPTTKLDVNGSIRCLALGIGGSPSAGQNLYLVQGITGNVNSTAVRQQGVVDLASVTSSCYAFDNVMATSATAVTLGAYVHYSSQQGTIGAGATVTSQYGFLSAASLVGATNNTAFFADNTAAITAGKIAIGFYSNINAPTGGGTTWGFYAAGTAANLFNGPVTVASLNGGQLAGLRNRIINGAMLVSQRAVTATVTAGTAVPTASTGYPCVDRFFVYSTGANVSVSQTGGTPANSQRITATGVASVTAIGIGQRIESANSFDLSSKTCTLSAVLSNSLLTTITWIASYANGTDVFGTIGTPTKTQIATGTFTVTSTDTLYSVNISVPSAATTGIEILFTVGAQISGTFSVSNVQFEAGTIATPFERRPYGMELALCQRYYQKTYDDATAPATATRLGLVSTMSYSAAANYGGAFNFNAPMRAVPTFTYWDGAGNLSKVSYYAASAWVDNNAWLTILNLSAKGANASYSALISAATMIHYTLSAEL